MGTLGISSPIAFPSISLHSKRYHSQVCFTQITVNSMPNPKMPTLSSSPSSMACPAPFAAGALTEDLGVKYSGSTGEKDLLIVGPGVLGRLVAQLWREDYPDCQVFGQTVTTDHHDELVQMGISPLLKGTTLSQQFPFVIFCAPPSRSPDYAGDVRDAASSWSGKGSFVFTSSSVLYDCADNENCDEESPAVPMGRSPRTDVLLRAEDVVLEYGGCFLRLAGLYKADRGAHTFWLKQGKSELRPDHIVNQIHYSDAASLVVAMLKKNASGRVFLGSDNHPLSRQEIMDSINKSGKFSKKFEGFTGTSGPLGKTLNNSRTRADIGWEPKYHSFGQFLEAM